MSLSFVMTRSKQQTTADNAHPILGYINRKFIYRKMIPVYPVLVTVHMEYHASFADLLA